MCSASQVGIHRERNAYLLKLEILHHYNNHSPKRHLLAIAIAITCLSVSVCCSQRRKENRKEAAEKVEPVCGAGGN